MIDFKNYIVRNFRWTDMKAIVSSKNIVLQHDDDGSAYTVYGYDGPEVNVCVIWKGAVPDGIVTSGFSQSQNDTDKTDFETNFKQSSNRSIDQRSSDGRVRVAVEKTDRSKKTIVSHDWSDKTTWAEKSVRVVDQLASGSGDGLNYSLPHQNIVDTYHGKVTQECFLKDASGNSYRVIVKVNGETKTERDPHYGSGGDYVLNYESGTLTFSSPMSASDQVTVTYHHESGSLFTVKPDAGKSLKIEFAEVQFSADIQVMDTVVFQPYGYVDVFAPQLLQSNGGPLPSGTKIPLGDPVKYKTMTDYQNEAVKSHPEYPSLGGSGWRGATQPIIVLDWDYVASTVLKSSAGMEIRVFLEHDRQFEGWYATATFYCVSEDE